MKSLSLIFILFICCFHAFAQQYVPMPTGNAYWRYRFVYGGQAINGYVTQQIMLIPTNEDTVINNIIYKKILQRKWDTTTPFQTFDSPAQPVAQTPDQFYTGIREDNKKVFIYNNQISADTAKDLLLYDFNLAIGDTMRPVTIPGDYTRPYKIVEVDSMEFDDIFHKRFRCFDAWSSGTDTFDIIEGVGTEMGLIIRRNLPVTYNDHKFLCFVSDTSIYGPACGYIWPQGTPTSVDDISGKTEITVYPNPFLDKLTIKSKGMVLVTMYNMTGQLVARKHIQGSVNINSSNLPNGLYLLKLQDQQGNLVHSQRIIKQ